MYAIVLAVIKVVSEGVTVSFGIWGLFPEPKAEQAEIIRHRRIAAMGIIIGFIFSVVTAAIETKRELAAERAHAQEIRRLLQPLGAMSVSLKFQVDKQRQTSGPLKDFRNFLASRNPKVMVINHQDLPPELRNELMKVIENIEQTWVDLFRKVSCDPIPALPYADMQLYPYPFGLGESRLAYWTYDYATGDITYTRSLFLHPFTKNAEIASVEDIIGSTIVINSPAFSEPDLAFESFILNATEGARFIAKSSDMKKDQNNNYCYSFKPK